MDFELKSGKYKSIDPFRWGNIPEFTVITGGNGSGKTQLLELINYCFQLDGKQPHNNHPLYDIDAKVTEVNYKREEVVYISSNYSLGNLPSSNLDSLRDLVNVVVRALNGNERNGNQRTTSLVNKLRKSHPDKPSPVTQGWVQENLPHDIGDYLQPVLVHEGLNESFYYYLLKSSELRNKHLNEDVILERLGEPPWEELNSFLCDIEFKYEFQRPTNLLSNNHTKIICKNEPDLSVNFSDLSSGEKSLISLALWRYNSKKEGRLPKLMLLDEPDSHLHPTVCKQFISLVKNKLVEESGIRVILTTHSPITVSFCPESSLYEKCLGSIQKISKDGALNILTDGLVKVGEIVKHVFVEDRDDAEFYKRVYIQLRRESQLIEDVEIVFSPVSNRLAGKSGGKNQTIAWVTKLREQGLSDIFNGIVDRDREGSSSTPVNGIEQIGRYCLENYLIDPVVVFTSSIRDDDQQKVPGISCDLWTDGRIGSLSEDELQLVANQVISRVLPHIENCSALDTTEKVVEFTNGQKIKYPKWLIDEDGKRLIKAFRKEYKHAANTCQLLKAFSNREMVPIELKECFISIQKN